MSYRKIDFFIKAQIIVLQKRDHWRLDAIANKLFITSRIARRWEERIRRYEQSNLSRSRRANRSFVLCTLVKNNLLKFRKRNSWTYQDEMRLFLIEKWNMKVTRQTINNILKNEVITRKKEQRIEYTQSAQLRLAWQIDMTRNFVVKQLVFIDESLFKLQTSWRCMIYDSIDHFVRWVDDMRKDDIFNILLAYDVNDYLSCTNIKKSYYNDDVFYNWVINDLLSHCNAFLDSQSVICMNNLNVHLDARVKQTIEDKNCLIRFLFFYSSNYNSIEFTFSILKTWMRRHFRQLRAQFESNFEDFLKHALKINDCSDHAKTHFRHNVESYKFESDYETFQRQFAIWSNEK